MGGSIDNDILISLVEARPVLWDKSLETFKDRNLTRDAWKEVCCALKNGFEDLEEKEKNSFGKEVTKRWGNLRDAFSKSKKKLKGFQKSDAGAPNMKRYVYADQMQFLNKLFEKASTVAESFETTETDNNEDEDINNPVEATLPPKNTNCNNPNPRGYKRRRQPDEVELTLMKALKEPPQSPQMSFFHGLMPHLNKFDESELLEFQMGVLEVISKINNKRKNSAQPQFCPQQPPSFYPNNYTPFPNYPFPPQQFQTHQYANSQNNQFKNPPNPNNTDSSHQKASSSKGHPLEHQQQTTAQYYQDFCNTSAATSPGCYPSASPSPAGSVYSDSTYDFS